MGEIAAPEIATASAMGKSLLGYSSVDAYPAVLAPQKSFEKRNE
jgi:hypothetical protein